MRPAGCYVGLCRRWHCCCCRHVHTSPSLPTAPLCRRQPLELLSAVPAPAMSFEGAPTEGDLNELEQRARQLSLHAHKLVKENK